MSTNTYVAAQACKCTNCPFPIPDNGTVVNTISVNGATNNDLATNNDICKICVRFKHELLGDLVIKIQSPSGQVLALTGPVSQNSLTNFSVWDVCFIPCSVAASPYTSGSFSSTSKWSNDQAWGTFGNYGGTYYPYQACFSTIETGPVNGNWRLVVTDADALQTGEILDWSIEFCNPTGIACVNCAANAGTIPTTPVTACAGSNALKFNVTPTYVPVSSLPLATQYAYQYVISKNDVIVAYQTQPDLKSFAPGQYQVCGMSYRTSEAGLIPPPNGVFTVTDLKDLLGNITPPFCAKLTNNCFNVTIKSVPLPTNITRTICSNQSYKVGNQVFKVTGNYQVTLVAANGCDSIVNLNLTVKPTVQKVVNETICQGSSFKIGTSIYTKQGNYKDSLQTTFGCDSVVFLFLAVTPVPSKKISRTICEGDSVKLGTKFYKKTGIYQDTFKLNTCDTAYQLTLKVAINKATTIDTAVCKTFSYGSLTYTSSGIYNIKLKNKIGCDSIIDIKLTIKQPKSDTVKVTKCFGQTHTFEGSIYSSSGTYLKNLTASNGCDSILVLKLMIQKAIKKSQTIDICSGKSIKIGKNTYFKNGVYQDTLISKNGCDSLLTTTLNLSDTIKQTIAKSICQGTSFVLGNTSYSTTGTYNSKFTTKSGCDSIVTLKLTIIAQYKVYIDTTVCFGEFINIGTFKHQVSGAYIDTLNSKLGCDSIVYTTLKVRLEKKKELFLTLCEGKTVTIAQNTYSKTGTYLDLKLPTADGCDSTINLYLTIKPNYNSTITRKLCFGEKYKLNNKLFTTKGTYTEKMLSKFGCDSTITLNLDFYPEAKYDLNAGICKGESFIFEGKFYDKKGVYYDTLNTVANCDSVIKITITANPDRMESITRTICEGDSIDVGFSTYKKAGVYKDTLFSNPGCDSIVTLTLLINKTAKATLSKTLCFKENIFINNIKYSKSGIYNIKLKTKIGCDSILTLILSEKDSIGFAKKDTICAGQSLIFDGKLYDKAGVFDIKQKSLNGCDSTIRLTLTVVNCNSNISYKAFQPICGGDSTGRFVYKIPLIPVISYDVSWKKLPLGNYSIPKKIAQGAMDSVTNLRAGKYLVRAIANGITKYDTIVILDKLPLTIPLFILSSTNATNLRCANDLSGAITAIATGGTAPYSYLWNTNATSDVVSQLRVGTYTVTATDANQCKASRDISVIAPSKMTIDFALTQATCKQLNNAAAYIKTIKNGKKPYTYSIDNKVFENKISFQNLTFGQHKLSVKDTFGCVSDTVFELKTPNLITVSLGADTTIRLGDTLFIAANVNVPFADIDTLIWSTNLKPSCPTCPYGNVAPKRSTRYIVRAIDKAGCEATAYKIVTIDETLPVFVPTAFSPNGDGNNDFFNIFADKTVRTIKTLNVFDRWGTQVYKGIDLEPNNDTQGWDGTFRGQNMNSAVFVFQAEILLKNGSTRTINGEIMLVR